jgi:DNA mismatch repair protein MutS2
VRFDDEEDDGDELNEDLVVEIPFADWIDLHGFSPKEVLFVVASYLDEAYAAGLPGVRLIHGKGIGALREAVRKLLAGDRRVASFGDAPLEGGGWGATVVTFKR